MITRFWWPDKSRQPVEDKHVWTALHFGSQCVRLLLAREMCYTLSATQMWYDINQSGCCQQRLFFGALRRYSVAAPAVFWEPDYRIYQEGT